MSQGDYGSILEKKPALTQEEAEAKIIEIQQNLREEKELLSLYANVQSSVEINEIFANGDMDDSGFDLISDLQIIEKVLFLVSEPTAIGGGYTGTSAPGGVPLPHQESSAASSNPNSQAFLGGSTSALNNSNEENLANDQTGSTSMPLTTAANEAGVDPNSCFIGDKYEQAFAAFEDKKQQDKNYKDLSGNVLPGAPQKNTLGNTTNIGDGDLDLATAPFLPAQSDVAKDAVKAAPADQWLKDKPCTDVLCLKIEEIMKPATSAFQDSDNCIACHVEKINDTLKNVITHTLVPS